MPRKPLRQHNKSSNPRNISKRFPTPCPAGLDEDDDAGLDGEGILRDFQHKLTRSFMERERGLKARGLNNVGVRGQGLNI